MIIPITPVRKEISSILDRLEVIDSIEGIKLIEKRDYKKDHLDGFNCVKYCFEKEKPLFVNIGKLPEIISAPVGNHFEVEIPKEGDLAVYVGVYEGILDFTHVGKVLFDGNIISKFCYREIYVHSPDVVPLEYGDTLRFFRKKV